MKYNCEICDWFIYRFLSFCLLVLPIYFFPFFACPCRCLRHPESITESSNWNVFPVNSQNNLSHIAKLTSRFILFFVDFYLVVVIVVVPLYCTQSAVWHLVEKAEKTKLPAKKRKFIMRWNPRFTQSRCHNTCDFSFSCWGKALNVPR